MTSSVGPPGLFQEGKVEDHRIISEEDAANGIVLGPDGYIYVPPPQSQQLRIDMQVSVTACQTWREVLETVERDGDLFDFRNTSTAVHRVARYGAEESHLVLAHPVFPRLLLLLRAKCKDLSARSLSDAAWGLAKIQCRDEDAFRLISARARRIMNDLDPQGLALTAWAFATIARQDDELFTALAGAARSRMRDFGPQNIANFIWATATLGFRCDPLHADIVAATLEGMDDFSAQNLAMVNWALAKLAFQAGDAWRAAFRRRMMQLKEYAPSELSMMAWALATRGDYDPELMAYIARRSMELMRGFTGQHVATIIWAIATVSYKDDPSIDEFLSMALGAIIARAHEFQPLNLALISWGLAKMSYRAEVAFEALCAAATVQMDDFVPQNLVQIMWACATCGYRDDAFVHAASRVAKRRFRDFSSQHLSNFIWACARLAFKEDLEVLGIFSAEAIRKMHEGSPQHLSNIAWAVSQLGSEHFPGVLSAVVAETTRRINEFDSPSLMMLSDSLYDAKFGEGREEPLLNVLRSHIMGMGRELLRIFRDDLPARRGLSSPMHISEYQRSLRALGLVTFGYEHTHQLFSELSLAEGRRWDPAEASSMPGWTTNARRSTSARRFDLQIGLAQIQDAGSVFTSAFASSSEDATCDFIITWLGHGKSDAPSSGRASRIGDAECRAMLDAHGQIVRAVQEQGSADVSGWMSLHTSGVPCLSCVGVAAQFKRCYPRVAFCFTFAPREHGYDVPDIAAVPQGPRVAPRSGNAESRDGTIQAASMPSRHAPAGRMFREQDGAQPCPSTGGAGRAQPDDMPYGEGRSGALLDTAAAVPCSTLSPGAPPAGQSQRFY